MNTQHSWLKFEEKNRIWNTAFIMFSKIIIDLFLFTVNTLKSKHSQMNHYTLCTGKFRLQVFYHWILKQLLTIFLSYCCKQCQCGLSACCRCYNKSYKHNFLWFFWHFPYNQMNTMVLKSQSNWNTLQK